MAKNVLVFVQGTIGDTIVSIPALKALRRHYGPASQITLLHERHDHLPFNPVSVLGQIDLVDNFLSYPFHFKRIERFLSGMKLLWDLWRKRFDVVYYLIASDREVAQIKRDNIFFSISGIRERYGFEIAADRDTRPKSTTGEILPVMHEAITRLKIVELGGVDTEKDRRFETPLILPPKVADEEVDNWLRKRGISINSSALVAIAPGAKKKSCHWPLDRFAELGKHLLRRGATLVVIGGKAEIDDGIALTEVWGSGLNACGELSVLATGALLRRCRFLLGLDTGTTHLAAVLGTPCVALYSAQDWPGKWEPIGTGSVVIRRIVPCAGCRLVNCNLLDHPCMTRITVREVAAVLDAHFFTVTRTADSAIN
jgi:heptosyltransferase-3